MSLNEKYYSEAKQLLQEAVRRIEQALESKDFTKAKQLRTFVLSCVRNTIERVALGVVDAGK